MNQNYKAFQLSLLLFLILTPSYLFSQSVSGLVMDTETKETIPFATVQIGENFGVITNGEGIFEINTERFSAKDSLSFSFMGYEKQQIALKNFNKKDTVFLKQSVNTLDKVYLIDKNLNPETIIYSVKANLAKNYPKTTQKLTAFQRTRQNNHVIDIDFEVKKADFVKKETLKNINTELDSFSKRSKDNSSNIYYDTYLDIYKSAENPFKVDVKKGTKLFNRERSTSSDNIQNKALGIIAKKIESSNSFKLRSGILPMSDSVELKSFFLRKVDTISLKEKSRNISSTFNQYSFGDNTDFDFITDNNKYSYIIKKAIDYNDEMVYVLSFEPDRGSAKYTGDLYISSNTFAVLKMDYKLAEGETGKNLNLKFLLGIKYEETEKSVLVIYQKSTTKKYYNPKYIKVNSKQYTYFNRSLTFIENNKDRQDRIKLKFDILSEAIVNKENEILLLNTEMISESTYENFKQKEVVELETIEQYDPILWESYNIIAPDKAIKEFEY